MRLAFDFGNGGRLLAEFLDKGVERTELAIAKALPIRTSVFQARWSGREIFLPVSLPEKPPRENQSIRAAKGDVIYFYEWPEAYNFTGFEAIGLFYGNEIVREWRGDCPVNVIARIDPSQFELLDKLGERIWRKGGETIVVSADGYH
jgi:hypothetical protein